MLQFPANERIIHLLIR